MTQVLLAVDFEFDLILFELLSEVDDVTIVARPADEVELLALCRTGSADVVIVGQYFRASTRRSSHRSWQRARRCWGSAMTPRH